MKKTFCDRCGKEVEAEVEFLDWSDDFPYVFSRARIVKKRYTTIPERRLEDYETDLCLECTRELNEWYGWKNGTDLEDKKDRD